MRIKTRLRVSIILCVVLTVTIGSFLFMAVKEMNDESEEARVAANIVKDMAELNIVTHDYLLHPGKRPLMQWKSKYDSLTKYLAREVNKFHHPNQKIALGKIVQNLARFETVFKDLTTGLVNEQGLGKQKNTISLLVNNNYH